MATTKGEAVILANKLIEWVDNQDLPEQGIKLDRATTIIHTPRYIEINKDRLNNCEPLSRCWRTGYMALYNLKKVVENDYKF